MEEIPTSTEPVRPDRPPRGGTGLVVSRSTGLQLAFASFLTVLFAFLPGQLIQLLNVPFGLFATSLLIFGAAGLIFPTAFNLDPFRFTGLSRIPWNHVLLAIVIGAVNLPLANTLMGAAKELLPARWSELADDTTMLLLKADGLTRFLIIAAAAIAAPIGEELFFRGWLQGVLSQVWPHIRSALVVAALFSAVHMDAVGFVARVELGFLFGLLRSATGSLWPSIAMHATHNALSTVALYWLTPDAVKEMDQPIEWRSALIWATISFGGVLFLLSWLDVRRPAPIEGERVPLRWTPARAAPLVLLNAGLLVGVTVFLWAARDRLPGASLTRPAPPASTPVSPVPAADPKDGRNHLK